MAKVTPNEKQNSTLFSQVISVCDLTNADGSLFDISPDEEARKEISGHLGLLKLRKLRFQGKIVSEGKNDWRLNAKLGATVEQACVITSEPVTTRIDTPETRVFLRDFKEEASASETEFDGQDEGEPLESEIDLGAVMIEALALALPEYPRSPGAELKESLSSPPGTTPLDEESVKPFASLAALRDKLGK